MNHRRLRCLLAACLVLLPVLAGAADIAAELELEPGAVPVRELAGWDATGPVVVRAESAERLAWLQAGAGPVRLLGAATDAEALALVPGARGLVGFCSAELLAAAPQLHWIQLYSAGAENCLAVPAVHQRPLLLTNMQRVSGPEIAEHALGMLLSFTRGLHGYARAQAEGRWDPARVPMPERWELSGRTLLVVGLGGIGSQVARRARAMGMRVVAVRASGRPGPAYVDEVATPDRLLELAGRADAIVNAAPYTAATDSLFDAAFFARMQPSAYFINVGRGASVVTDDLVAALRRHELAGAGLDVTEPEPLPPDHPLWQLPNVIITPHVAAGSDRVRQRLFEVVRENLRRYGAGEPLLSVVDPERGY